MGGCGARMVIGDRAIQSMVRNVVLGAEGFGGKCAIISQDYDLF